MKAEKKIQTSKSSSPVLILVFFKEWTMDKAQNRNCYKNNEIGNVRRAKNLWHITTKDTGNRCYLRKNSNRWNNVYRDDKGNQGNYSKFRDQSAGKCTWISMQNACYFLYNFHQNLTVSTLFSKNLQCKFLWKSVLYVSSSTMRTDKNNLLSFRNYFAQPPKCYRHANGKAIPLQGFQDRQHMKMVRLSALRTGHLYPSRSIPGTHFC